jgi:hypothetical protein
MSCDKLTSVYEQKEGIVLSRSSLPERIRHERHAQHSNIKHKQKELDTPRFERGFLTSVESLQTLALRLSSALWAALWPVASASIP